MPATAADPAYCRLTVLAPNVRVDVALPADVPVAELVPMVLELLGEPVFGLRPRPWRLSTALGGPLPPGRSLRELGVLDGEMLRIAPAGGGQPPPVFDDPVDALARTASASAADDRRFRSLAAVVLVAVAALLLAGWPPPAVVAPLLPGPAASNPGQAAIAGAAALVAFAYAAWLARRSSGPIGTAPDPIGRPGNATERWSGAHHLHDGEPWSGADQNGPGDRWPPPGTAPPIRPHPTDADIADEAFRSTSVHIPRGAVTAAWSGVLLATIAGWTASPAASGEGRLLVAAVAAGGSASLALLATRVLVPALLGIVVAALPAGVAAMLVLRWHVAPSAAAVGLGAFALAAGPLLPRAALWLARWPRPVVASDAGELVEADDGPDLLPPGELVGRAVLARGYLAGMVGGCSVVAAAAALPAAAVSGWTGPTFAVVTIGLLGLRARGFVDIGPARFAAASALAATVGLAVVLGNAGGPAARPIAAGALLVTAAAITNTIDRTRTAGSPVRRRAVDLVEALLTAAVLPLALGVTDMYALVRGL